MARLQLLDLPDELLGAIINQSGEARDTVALGLLCKRVHQLAVASPAWRRHCLATWTNWDLSHDLQAKLAQRALQTDWRALFLERIQIDHRARQLFELLLATQQARALRMNEVAALGPDVEDLLARQLLDTPDDADDVLARRWHADAILRLMGRRHAIEIWRRLDRGQHVELEEALGAYDEFVLGRTPPVECIKSSLTALAVQIREGTSGFDGMTIRQQAVRIAQHLRSKGVVGLLDLGVYHALRNNFISLALVPSGNDARGRGCLPLQSVAIYCAVARRLGIFAQPSNFPRHVHAVIIAPPDTTLDGAPRLEVDDYASHPEMMHMDPFRQDGEVSQSHLLEQLSRMGVEPHRYADFLGPTNELEMVLRMGRNILVSVDGLQLTGGGPPEAGDEQDPDPDIAKYAALWSHFIHGDSNPVVATTRRRQAIRHLFEKFQSGLLVDVEMFAETAPLLLEGQPDVPLIMALTQNMLASGREPKVPVARSPEHDAVKHRIGTYFEHVRYGYNALIVGWTPRCAATSNWIEQMRIDDLPRGRDQPFYSVFVADKSQRYVAEENIRPLRSRPSQALMQLAGKFFKRWDGEQGRFVSNIRDEYPDD